MCFVHRRSLRYVAFVVALLGLAALITILSPPSAFRDQARAGAVVYTQNCLSCHGGAGGPGVPGKTEPLEGARFVARNPTALEIFDVVRSGREGSLRALTDDQLWAAIAAELLANGVDLGNERLGITDAGFAPTSPGAATARPGFFPPGR